MKNTIVLYVIITFLGNIIMPAFGQSDIKPQNKSASGFVLEDQFKKEQEINFPSEKERILVFFKMTMGNEPYDEGIEWKSYIESHFNDSIKVYLIGIHSTVPFFVKSIIRSFLDDKERILLDWGGDIAEKYGFQDETILFYTSKNGLIKSIVSSKYTEKKLKNFTKTIGYGIKE